MYNGGPVAWGSRRQACVSLSTTEAEYIGMCEAAKDIVWTRRLLNGIGCDQKQPTGLFWDNKGTLKLV